MYIMKNHFSLITLVFLLCAVPSAAQRNVAKFKEYTIEEGSYSNIAGQKRYEPDIYYTKSPDGTYTAHRLTVTPNGKNIRVSEPYLFSALPDGITIGWKTSTKPDNTEVIWGETEDQLNHSAEFMTTELSSSYFWNTSTLTGLQPDCIYYYKVKCNGHDSGIQRFRTLPQNGHQGVVRFLIFGDHQRNLYSDYEWMLRMAERKLNERYGEKPIEEHVSFIMNMGDQVDQGTLKQYDEIHRFKNRSVMSRLPIQTVVGNHDTYGDTDMRFYNGHYNAYRKASYRGLDAGTANYYAYQAGRVLWIGINSDGASDKQLQWIRNVVNTADADPTVDCIISVQHRPLYAEMYSTDVSAWMLKEVMPVLNQSPKHVMNCAGHHHLYARGQMPDHPVYHVISGGGVGIAEGGYLQLWGVTDVDIRDHDHVQATIDHWTYQIVEYDPASTTLSVESYSVGNKRLALDNVLVDSFSRKLNAKETPETPTFSLSASAFTLPTQIEQENDGEKLHSAQYQIARDKDFKNVVHERVLTFENLYKVDKNYLPLDQYALKPVTRLELEEGTVAPGTYYLRARNRNMNLDYSDWSNTLTIRIKDPNADMTVISADKTHYGAKPSVVISYSNAPTNEKTRIAVYRNGVEPATASMPYAYKQTDGTEGTVTFKITDYGKFYAVMLKGEGYEECSNRCYFRIGEGTVEFSLNKLVYEAGEPITLFLEDVPAQNNDWVGIYAQGITPQDAICPSWKYVGNNTTTQIDLNVADARNYNGPLQEGCYFANYFKNDGYDEAYDRIYFVIGKPASITAETDNAREGEELAFSWNGLPEQTECQLAHRPAGSGEEIAWVIVNGIQLEGNAGSIAVKGLPAGEHDISILLAGKRISNTTKVNILPGTGIGSAKTPEKSADAYTVDGKKTTSRTPKGIYIIDGKKYINQ